MRVGDLTAGLFAELLDRYVHPCRLMVEERTCTAADCIHGETTTTPSCRMMIRVLPPISGWCVRRALLQGCNGVAVISFLTTSAPTTSAASRRPPPVVPAPNTCSLPRCLPPRTRNPPESLEWGASGTQRLSINSASFNKTKLVLTEPRLFPERRSPGDPCSFSLFSYQINKSSNRPNAPLPVCSSRGSSRGIQIGAHLSGSLGNNFGMQVKGVR